MTTNLFWAIASFLSIASTVFSTSLPGQSFLFVWSSSAKQDMVQSHAVDIPSILSEVDAQKGDNDILLIWKCRYSDVDQLLKYRSFFEAASSRTSYENAAIRLSPGTEQEQPFTSQVLARDTWKAAKHLSSLSEVSQELKKNLATRAAKSPVYMVDAAAQELEAGQTQIEEIRQTVLALNQQSDRVLLFFFMEPEEVAVPALTHLPAGHYSRLLASTSTSNSIHTASTSTAASSNPSSSVSVSTNSSGINKYSPEGCEYSMYYGGKYLYITPDIFTGIMTGLFFVFVFFIGLGQLSAIQGMSTFYDKLPSVGKEN